MTTDELERLIEGQAESQSLDFKANMPWDFNSFAKDFMAMANVRDGGTILIGVRENGPSFEREGVSEENRATYKIDDIRDKLRKYTDPCISFDIKFPVDNNNLQYVSIHIHSFKEVPVICVIANQDARLQQSTIYYRNTNGRVQSGAISNSSDLRDVIELASARLRKRREDSGYIVSQNDKFKLDKELDGLSNNGRLDILKSRGFWRINFQPVKIDTIPSLESCLKIAAKAKVSLRGWDFPHIPSANFGEGHYIGTGDNFYEAWTNMGAIKEYWRFYKSSQFIYYKAVAEDWFAEDPFYAGNYTHIQPGTSLGILHSVVYYFTEIFEFLSRLASQELYKEGVTINVSLHNTANRGLWVDGQRRASLMYPRITRSNELAFTAELSHFEMKENCAMISHRYILEWLDKFGFNPSPDSIQIDQMKFISGD